MRKESLPLFDKIFETGESRRTVPPLQKIAHAQEAPRSRSSNPCSSRRAEAQVKRTGTIRGQALIVLDLARAHPGLSSKQLAAFSDLDRYQIARRLPELQAAGLVRFTQNGKDDVCWWTVE